MSKKISREATDSLENLVDLKKKTKRLKTEECNFLQQLSNSHTNKCEPKTVLFAKELKQKTSHHFDQ